MRQSLIIAAEINTKKGCGRGKSLIKGDKYEIVSATVLTLWHVHFVARQRDRILLAGNRVARDPYETVFCI